MRRRGCVGNSIMPASLERDDEPGSPTRSCSGASPHVGFFTPLLGSCRGMTNRRQKDWCCEHYDQAGGRVGRRITDWWPILLGSPRELAIGRSAKFNPTGIDDSGATGRTPTSATSTDGSGATGRTPPRYRHRRSGATGRTPTNAAGIDGTGATSCTPTGATGIDSSGTTSATGLARGGRYVGSKPTANPRGAAPLTLLRGAGGRYFRASNPRGHSPLPA